jgi:hypothetical protein
MGEAWETIKYKLLVSWNNLKLSYIIIITIQFVWEFFIIVKHNLIFFQKPHNMNNGLNFRILAWPY